LEEGSFLGLAFWAGGVEIKGLAGMNVSALPSKCLVSLHWVENPQMVLFFCAPNISNHEDDRARIQVTEKGAIVRWEEQF